VMAAGKPIIAIADSDSELALVVREEALAGWFLLVISVDSGRPFLKQSQSESFGTNGQRARQAAEMKYSFKLIKKAYIEMIASIYEEAV